MELIRKHKEVALETAFPQLFDGMGVAEFLKPTTVLLPTQRENVAKYPDDFWASYRQFDESIMLIYPKGLKEGLSIPNCLDTFVIPEPYEFALNPNPIWIETADRILGMLKPTKPVCLVKFPTERSQFNIPSRNPLTEYFRLFIQQNDYFYIDVTHTDENEWYASDVPEITRLDLDLNTLIGMMGMVSMNLFPPGFMIPLSIALGAKAICLFGGYADPELFIDSRMNLDNFTYLAPNPFCNCLKATHDCNKYMDERCIPRMVAA